MKGDRTNWRIDPSICKNPEAAKEHNALGDWVYRHPNRKWITSQGREINMFAWGTHIKVNTEGLPQEESDEIWRVHKEIHDALLKLGRLKKDAFQSWSNLPVSETLEVLDPVKAQILEWFGTLHSDSEVLEKLALQGLPINKLTLAKFKQKYKNQIEKLQSDYEKEWHTIGITRKRARLDQLSYMFNKHRKEFEAARGHQQLPYSKEMREILTQVKREVEGDNVHLTIDGKIDVNTTIQMNQSVEELYSNINFISLLVARVAARAKINPLLLQYYLFNGWYSKFSGVVKNQRMFDENPTYPSSIVMNWDTLREKHEEKQSKIDELVKQGSITEVAPIEGVKKRSLRELMAKKVKSLEDVKGNLTKL